MPITQAEAQGITLAFTRDYPGALALAYLFRETAAEIYGQDADEALEDMKGGYVPKETVFNGRVYPGRVDVVLGKARGTDDFLDTLRHEVLGHYGTNTFTPLEKRTLLDGLIAAREEPSLKSLWDDINQRYSAQTPDMRAEEVFALRCESVDPGRHLDAEQARRRGEQSFMETCVARIRPMQSDDLDNIACLVAQGLRDQTRTQRNFPQFNELFRLDEKKPFQNMEPINRIGFEQPDRQAVENAVIEAVQADPERFLRTYAADERSYGGRYVSADLFKEQFEPFSESNESRNRYNRPVHNAASVLASEQYRRVVADGAEPQRDTVVFLTGIPGAGKTSSILKENRLPDNFRAIFEGQLSRPEPAIAKIQQALDAGLKPEIMAVHVLPEKAFENTLKRFHEYGRGAGINVMADIQGRLPDGLSEIHKRFGDKVTLYIADYRDYANPKVITGWENLNLLRSEGNHEQIRQRLEHTLDRLRPGLSEAAYRQAKGLAPPDPVHGRAMDSESAGTLQAHEQRRSLPQGNSQASVLNQTTVIESAQQALIREHDEHDTRLALQGLNEMEQQRRTEKELERAEFIVPRQIAHTYTEVDGKFFAKDSNRVMFEDKGGKLATSTTDRQAIADMVIYARARQWDTLKLSGSPEFRREAWLQAESQGIRTQGYTPKDNDLAALKTLTEERQKNSITPVHERQKARESETTAQTPAPRHDLNKNQAVLHDEATKAMTANLQELKKNPALAERPAADLETLAYWRGILRENNKSQPKAAQDAALVRFDKMAEDPQFVKKLNQETQATMDDKTIDQVEQAQKQQKRDTHEQSL